MKNIILSFLFVFYSYAYKGQVGIGTTTPHSSALLDIDVSGISPKKGFLLPRVNLTNNIDNSTIPSPVNGLMAFNQLAAGSPGNAIPANSMVAWKSSSWMVFTNLPEIRILKPAVEYVAVSRNEQNFTTTGELTTANLSTPVVVSWLPGDIQVANPTDMQLVGNNIKFITDAFYELSGMITFIANVATIGDTSHVMIVLQSSPDGTTWSDIFGRSMPFESLSTGKSQGISIPEFVHHFSANEFLRVVIIKPTFANNYTSNSGLVTNNPADINKSLRIIRVKQ
ncbi:hypothetical protein [Chryseobacterium aurantiacum]|uniref:hypothetical protein n=1 Tax=Chryseobacterium aurantiacum TaxID=2116499 RepID=UPI000D135BE1|nr:hypothetical protein [Chryseobacterium aurantiacum]